MDRGALGSLLEAFRAGKVSLDDVLEHLATLPFRSEGSGLSLDTHRQLRCGFPEAILAQGKDAAQVAAAARSLAAAHDRLLVTRATPEQAHAVLEALPKAVHDPEARCVLWRREAARAPRGLVAVVSAGAGDRAVAREATLTLQLQDVAVESVEDVGVAGLHRLLAALPRVRKAQAVVAVAGMEGALPGVLAGLVAAPVIAVPTSVGYGASFGGLAALLAMLNSCAAGVSVVNIDNGFGAGLVAGRLLRASGHRPGASTTSGDM